MIIRVIVILCVLRQIDEDIYLHAIMYASQHSRMNTKYTDFIQNYFPDENTKHDVILRNNNLSNNLKPLSQQNSVLLAQSDPSLLISSESIKKTKFSDLFHRKRQANNRSFSKDPNFIKLESSSTGTGGGGGGASGSITKVYSDPNLLQLHNKVVNSINDVHPSARGLQSRDKSVNHNGSENSSNPTELLRDLERNLQKLNEETIQLLNRAKSNSISHLEDVVTQGGSDNVSYHEILKAEHIAIRRELLNNIREISRATFYDDLYAKNNNGGEVNNAGTEENDNGDGDGGFHLNQDTADPAERVDEWIRSSQEHLNKPRHRRSHSANSSEYDRHNQASVLTEKPGGTLHASLFHDSSAWHDDDNYDEPDIPTEDFVNDTDLPAATAAAGLATQRKNPPVKKNSNERFVANNKPVIFNISASALNMKKSQAAGRTNNRSNEIWYPEPRESSPRALMSPPKLMHARNNAHALFFPPLNSKGAQSPAGKGGQSYGGTFRRRAPFYRTGIADILMCNTEMEDLFTDSGSSPRRCPRPPLKRIQSLTIIPQPKTEKFPAAIYEPKKRYQNHQNRKNNTSTAVAVATLPIPKARMLFANNSRSRSLDVRYINNDDARWRPRQLKHDLRKPFPQVESQTVGYVKNRKSKSQVPGILRRSNMDQWVAKKVWFYVNGDEHRPKFEYRFRPKRDVKDLDTLCDILTNRINLPRGVRYIFTMDGLPVEKLDDLEHERHYVVSSTKKFKVTPYKDYFAPPKQPVTFQSRSKTQSL